MGDAGVGHQVVLGDGMARFVHRDLPTLLFRHLLDRVLDAGVLLQECPLDILLRHGGAVIEQGHAHGVLGDGGHDLGRRSGAVVHDDGFDIHRIVVVYGAQVTLDDLAPAGTVGQIHLDELIEPSGPLECRIDDVGTVGGAHEQHVPVPVGRLLAHDLEQLALQFLLEGLAVDAVHLVQQARQRAGAAAHEAAAAAAFTHHAAAALGDGVDLVNVGDGRAIALCQLARLADEPDHLHHVHTPEHGAKPGALDGYEGNPGLAGHGLGEHGLAGTGGTVEEQAVDVAAAHLHELLAVRQQPQPLAYQPFQTRLPPVVVEGDDLGIFRADTLDLGARHEPEQRPELDQHEQDCEQELANELQEPQKEVEQRLVGPDQDGGARNHHQRRHLADELAHLLAEPALLLDHLDAVLDEVGDAHVLPEARLLGVRWTAVLGRVGRRRRFRRRRAFLVLDGALFVWLVGLVGHSHLQGRRGGTHGSVDNLPDPAV